MNLVIIGLPKCHVFLVLMHDLLDLMILLYNTVNLVVLCNVGLCLFMVDLV